MKIQAGIVLCVVVSYADAFARVLSTPVRVRNPGFQLRMSSQKMGSVSSVPAGERKIEGDVMIVNHKNTIYALNPKCPHLGLPMKTGEITDGTGGPCITCKFHNSKFKLENGEAVEWLSGVMGFKNEFLGNVMGKVSGGPKPATVYAVSVEDGAIVVDTSKIGQSGVAA